MTQTINELTSFFVTAGYNDQSRIQPSTGFLNLWANAGPGSLTVRVNDRLDFSMDIVRNKKKINSIYPRSNSDAMTNLGSNAKTNTGDVFQNVTRDFPIMKSFANVSYDEMMRYRMPNELGITSTQRSSAAQITRAGMKLGQRVIENTVQDIGRMELMANEALRTGIITLDDTAGTTYNFGRASTNTDTVGTAWSNVAALGMTDLSNHYKTIRRNGKCDPRALIFAGDAFKEFTNLTEVKASADNKDINFVKLGDPKLAPLPKEQFISRFESYGFSYMGYFKDPTTGRKMYFFVYDDDYQNASDTWVQYSTAGTVLFMDPDMRLDRFFGPRIRFDYETPEERMIKRMLGINGMLELPPLAAGAVEPWMWHHDVMPNADKTSFGIETYTGPLFAPTEVDSAGQLTV